MVNIGGRSRGCSTCQKRRVRCDETRPVCTQCRRSRLECTGAKDMTFIESTIVKSRRTVRRTSISVGDRVPAQQLQSIPASLPNDKFEMSLFYSQRLLRLGGAIDLALQGVPLGDIITNAKTARNSQIFHQAFVSFALITFGSQHRQAQIIGQGYAIYGAVVKQLNQALSDSTRRSSDEVFLSVITLALLECLVPTGPNQYVKHMIALERLLELRKPSMDSHHSPKAVEFYKSVRHMVLFASLRIGKASILAQPEWKTFLRAHCSEEQLEEQNLFDRLADCTLLIAARDKFLMNWDIDSATSRREREEIKTKAISVLSCLDDWKERWNSDGRNSYSEKPMLEDTGKDSSVLFATTFEFANASSAVMFMFCNTTLIYVLRVLISLPVLTKDLGTVPDCEDALVDAGSLEKYWALGRNEYLGAERLAALEIYRCVPFDLTQRSNLGCCISPISHWAVTAAWTTLGGAESVEGEWMMNLFNATNLEGIAKGIWNK